MSVRGPDTADGKRYALTLKDDLVPPSSDGREQSSVSWEAQFVAEKPGDVKLPWDQFKATYRGREKEDAAPLNLKDIKRVGLMMRRYVRDYNKPPSRDCADDFAVSLENKTATFNCICTPFPHTSMSPLPSSMKTRRKKT